MPEITDIEIVADVTAGSRCDEGFLRLRRLRLRNRYADGTVSRDYDCDVVSRSRVDAVAVVVYEVGADRRVRVALKTGVRPPIWLRRDKDLVQPDASEHLLLPEIVAGMLEPQDAGPEGLARRAALECAEEAGYAVRPEATIALGGPLFASPGITDEKVFYRAVATELAVRGEAHGDGSVMEEAGDVLVLDLDDALARCRAGTIPDAKTEIALLRLCDHLGYVPALGCFVDDLPPGLRPPPERRERMLGR